MLAPAWRLLSDSEGKAAWEKGSAMSLESATQYSREESDPISSGGLGQ
jgi:hypothetical protein